MASTAPSVTAIPLPSPSLPPNQTASASLPPLSATPSSVATITSPVGAQARDLSDANGHTYAPPASASPHLNNGTPIDARVRNPVPSKLKGRIDGRNGNFSVMHMDLIRPDMTERDLAAKRSSEGTEAAARLANKEGYRPVKRTRWIPPDSHLYPSHPTLPPGLPRHPNALVPHPTIPPSASPSAAPPAPTSATSIALSATPQNIPMTTPSTSISIPAVNSALPPPDATLVTNSPHNPPLSTPTIDIEAATASISHPRSQLTPAETKVEQARLLALLPNLDPSFVVEKVCEALRHFGGVPGASIHDVVFPESASNGSGSLLVGWVAEIFSQVDASAATRQDKSAGTPISGMPSAASSNPLSVPVKRGRGRPKGSTKKSKEAKLLEATVSGINPVDGTAMPQAMPVGAMVDASQLNMDDANGTQSHYPGSALMEQNSDGSIMTPGLRKRGRPKGSKNKPKSKPTDNDGTTDQADNGAPHQSQCSMMDSPLAHKPSGQSRSYYTTNETGVEPNLHITAPHLMQDYSSHAQSRAHANNGLPQDVQIHSPSNQNNSNVTPRPSTWKRKNSRHSQLGNQDTPETNDMLQSPGSTQNHTPTSQLQQQVKRRRVSREANQHLGPGGMDSQLSGPEILASPLIGTDGQPLSPVKQLRHNINLIIQDEMHKQQHHQPSGMEQQSPNPAHGPSPGMQRNQSGRGQGPSQTTMSAPTFFQPPRQMPNPYGHGENHGERFGRGMGPNQYHQHMMNSSPGLGSQPPQPQSQQQQQQPGRPSHPIASFQGYADPSYLGMDYSGTPASFGGHTQLEAALVEPSVNERIFHTMGRR